MKNFLSATFKVVLLVRTKKAEAALECLIGELEALANSKLLFSSLNAVELYLQEKFEKIIDCRSFSKLRIAAGYRLSRHSVL